MAKGATLAPQLGLGLGCELGKELEEVLVKEWDDVSVLDSVC